MTKQTNPDNKRATAVLFAGGGAKGAVQVGYMNHIVGRLRWPVRWVYGVSTGALQATLLAHGLKSGLALLNKLWLGLEKTSDLFEQYPWWKKAYNVVRGSALASNAPLGRLLDEYVSMRALNGSNIKLKVGVTNFNTKKFVQVGPDDFMPPGDKEAFLQYVLASTSIPGEFGGQKVPVSNDFPAGWCFDGGVTNVIPTLDNLIKGAGVERVVVCLCNPMELEPDDVKYDRLIRNVKEALSISMHDNWITDLRFMQRLVESTNAKIRRRHQRGYEHKRIIDFIIMSPSVPLPIGTLDIDPGRIRQSIKIGERIAAETIDDYYEDR